MKQRILRSATCAAAALAAATLWSCHSRDDADRIHVNGNIELTEVDMSFKTAGKLVARLVDEGDFVKKGDVVARLDQDQLVQAKYRDQAAITSADSQFAQLGTSIAMQRETLEGDIAAKRADLAQAQAKLDEMLAGSRRQDIEQAQAAVADARAQYQLARNDWTRAQTLYKNEDISRAQFEQYRTRFQSAGAQMHEAERRSSLVEEGPRKEDIAAGRAQVAEAQAAVKLAEANRLELRRKQQEVAERRSDIDRAKAQFGITESQLGDTVIRSPIDGVVLVKSAEPGEVLAAGTTVVTIGDIEHPWLRAYVDERDLGRVKLGQKATITSDSFPGKTYDGRLSFIASDAEFTPKQIQTKEERVKLVYRVKIDVDNSRHELKNNMPVEADILVGK